MAVRELWTSLVLYWERAMSVHYGAGGVPMHDARDEYDETAA